MFENFSFKKKVGNSKKKALRFKILSTVYFDLS